ncbi:hypothetical protein Taro_042935 [Colocasia esculenta]|uniref:Uncharacterized protein n=1 Tax=Colocasia esculenta TaxID=4460 RepID=A0A843WQ42_COLES|nr:hypothetical protein [Colocasia esculenta]
MTSDRRDRLAPCVGSASDSRNRGNRYCQKTLESGRSSARIAISECATKVSVCDRIDSRRPRSRRGILRRTGNL